MSIASNTVSFTEKCAVRVDLMSSIITKIKVFSMLNLLLDFLYSKLFKKVKLCWIWKLRRKNEEEVLLKVFSNYTCKECSGFKLVQSVHSFQGL